MAKCIIVKNDVTIQPNPTITRIYIRDAFTIGFS